MLWGIFVGYTINVNGENKGFNKVTQNIISNPYPTEDKEVINNADTIFIEGNNDKTSVGYYFPKSADLNFRNVENTGTWQSIGSSRPMINESIKEVEKNYLEIWVHHGINPVDSSYEYVILPNKSNEELNEYSKNPKIEILSNTKELQSVKHKGLNIISFNSFVDDSKTIEYLTVN